MDTAETDWPRHLAGICALTLLLLWPAIWSGAPTSFSDTSSYYNGGGVAVEVFLDRTGLSHVPKSETAQTGTSSGAQDSAGTTPDAAQRLASDHRVANVRSVPYAVFVNLAIRTAGPMAAVIPLALVTAWLIWLLMTPLRPALRLAGGAVTALATTAPFYASQIMPDIQAAWLIAIPIIVLGNDKKIGWPLGFALFAAATAAIMFHYSHIPLAAATGLLLGLRFVLKKRVGAALVVQLPLVLALATNIGFSLALAGTTPPQDKGAVSNETSPVVEDEDESGEPRVSIAPGRLPIVLARLLEDGVALRYLSETCPGNGFTICEVYDRFPENVGAALWGENSIRARATPAQMRRITAEEMALAGNVMLYDPLGQFNAMARNTLEQLFFFRLHTMRFTEYDLISPIDLRARRMEPPAGLFGTASRILYIAVGLSTLILLGLAWRVRATRWPIALLFTGLLANAFICGALSAPAGRYQGRVIWLTVALALSLALSQTRQARQTAPA